MSFSSNVKKEICSKEDYARHCEIAFIAGIMLTGGHFSKKGDSYEMKLTTENLLVAQKYFTLFEKTFNIECSIRNNTENHKLITIEIADINFKNALKACGFLIDDVFRSKINPLVVSQACCKRAFLSGAFLSGGSVTNPEKTYHLEIVSYNKDAVLTIETVLKGFGLVPKIIKRQNYHVLYIKDGEQIVDFLNIVNAHLALMELENVRIVKEVRNDVNRALNFEMANLEKTVMASNRYIDDIKYIEDTVGLSYLSETLEELALIRMQNPELTLKDLGDMVTPKVSKSCINHRLRKISEIANSLKDKRRI